MNVEIIPITLNNLSLVSKAAAKFGMPRSVGWLKRCFFDPTVEKLTKDKIRGHMSIDESGDIKAIQCYYYLPCYFRQTMILGNTGAILGADAKYGEEVLVVLDRNRETQTKGMLRIGNCIVGNRSATVAKKANRMKEAPYRSCEYRIRAIDWAAFVIAIIERMHLRSVLLKKTIFMVLRPLFWLRYWLHCFFKRDDVYRIVQHASFDDTRFEDFWRRFLSANEGVICSREPRRLQWLFNESIKAGKVLLATAEKADRIEGYVLLRQRGSGGLAPRSYDIIDICAIGNDITCLRMLACEATWIAGRNGGVKVYFEGCMPKQEEWLDEIFPYHKNGQLHTMYKVINPEIKDALEQNRGWFFGPLDGERCLGHGGYIDT